MQTNGQTIIEWKQRQTNRFRTGDDPTIPNNAESYQRKTPVRAQSVHSDVMVPLLQTAITCVLALIPGSILIWTYTRQADPVWYSVAAAFISALIAWQRYSQQASALTTQTETVTMAAVESEPTVTKVEQTITCICPTCKEVASKNTLDLSTALFEKLEAVARFVIIGNSPLSRRKIHNEAGILTQPQVQELQKAMNGAGYVAEQPNGSYTVTDSGREWLKTFLPDSSPAPSDD